MTAADSRRTSALTLVTLAVVVAIMAIWGFQAMTAPFDDASAAPDGPACAPEEQTIARVLRRSEITVSVYNTGKRSGRARTTLDMLEAAGFRPGAVGNAPDELEVPLAEVRTTRKDNPAAKLVAASFGKNTRIVVVDEDYGPGIDVFIGDEFKALKSSAPSQIALPEPVTTCG